MKVGKSEYRFFALLIVFLVITVLIGKDSFFESVFAAVGKVAVAFVVALFSEQLIARRL